MRKLFKRTVIAGAIAGVGYALWRFLNTSRGAPADNVQWQAAPFPFPPVPRPGTDPIHGAQPPGGSAPGSSAPGSSAPETSQAEPWVEADDGGCPATHPVKAKLSSGIFHVPGGANDERTHADRCYIDAEGAAADGLRQAQH